MKLLTTNSIRQFDRQSWNDCAGSHPYVQYDFFRALEESNSVGAQRSVIPLYFGLVDAKETLLACAPAMQKWGNKREFGPEMEWLSAGLTANCFAWPKVQIGVPFFTMPGPRILVRQSSLQHQLRQTMLRAIRKQLQHKNCTAFNIMNANSPQANELNTSDCLISYEANSVWRNQGYADFANYQQRLPAKKRLALRTERKSPHFAGVDFRLIAGADIPEDMWRDFYRGHAYVCQQHGNTPWLPETFYQLLGKYLAGSIVMFAAFKGGQFLAGALGLLDERTLYIQTWSALDDTPDLCFELLCYQPIDYAIRHQLDCVNSGPAASHKITRGFPAEPTANLHWLANPALKALAQARLNRTTPVIVDAADD